MKGFKRLAAVAACSALSLALALGGAAPALAYVQKETIVNSGHGYASPSYLVIHETANPGASAYNHMLLYSRGYDYAVQYVMETDGSTVYHCMADNRLAWAVGSGNYNCVNIELAHATNSSDFSKQFDEAAKWAAGYLKYRGWGIDRMISHNQCRYIWGGTDHTDPVGYFQAYGQSWDSFVARVKGYMNGGYQPSTDAGVPAQTPSTGTGFGGTYTCMVDALNVRSSIWGSVVAQYTRGQTVNLDDWYAINGGYVWGRYTSWSGATRYVAVGRATGAVAADDYLIKGGGAPVASGGSTGWRTGTYRFNTNVNIRSGAGTGYGIVGMYRAGQTVNISRTVAAGGYVWGVYTSYSGHTRYVALGTTGGIRYAS